MQSRGAEAAGVQHKCVYLCLCLQAGENTDELQAKSKEMKQSTVDAEEKEKVSVHTACLCPHWQVQHLAGSS